VTVIILSGPQPPEGHFDPDIGNSGQARALTAGQHVLPGC